MNHILSNEIAKEVQVDDFNELEFTINQMEEEKRSTHKNLIDLRFIKDVKESNEMQRKIKEKNCEEEKNNEIDEKELFSPVSNREEYNLEMKIPIFAKKSTISKISQRKTIEIEFSKTKDETITHTSNPRITIGKEPTEEAINKPVRNKSELNIIDFNNSTQKVEGKEEKESKNSKACEIKIINHNEVKFIFAGLNC